MLRVVVLGSAAGGGVPQWNCGCPVCREARSGRPGIRRTQASIAVTADDEHWFVINAAPELRQQIIDTPHLAPRPGALRHSPIAGVILTNGEVDAVAGLLSLREGWPFGLYAHPRVLDILEQNSIFEVLNRTLVRRIPMAFDTPFEPELPSGKPSGLLVTAFPVLGKSPWYLEEALGAEHEAGETIGLRISAKNEDRALFIVPACAAITPELRDRLHNAAAVFFDGTLWRDDELIELGLGSKTGARMGHVSMSGPEGAIAGLAGLGIGRKLFVHMNNSNPVLLADSEERRLVESAGWLVPDDGMEILI